MLGGAAPVVVISASAALLVALVIAASRKGWPRVSESWTLIASALAIAATFVQLVPAPIAFIRLVSDGAFDVLTIRADPRIAPFSLDPPATALDLVRYIGIFSAAAVAHLTYARRPRELFAAIAGSGVLVVALGVVHRILDWRRPYGRFGPFPAPFASSFVNPNHMGGFCGLCAFVALALAIDLKKDPRRWIAFAVSGICVAGTILSFSRGAVGALAIASVCYGVVTIVRGGRAQAVAPVLVLATIAGMLYAALSDASLNTEMTASLTNEIRPQLWTATVRATERFWAFGVGSGAYGQAMGAYQPAKQNTFTHAENQYLQCVIDWGIPFGLLFLTACAAIVVRIVRARRNDANISAILAGIAFCAIHAFVDFNLTLLAVAVPAAMCAAVVERRGSRTRQVARPIPMSDEDSRVAGRPWRRRGFLTGTVATSVLLFCAARYGGHYDLRADTQRLRDAMDREVSPDARAEALRLYTQRHPADFLGRLIVAERELREPGGARIALRFVNDAMLLAPNYAIVHRLAGRALLTLGVTHQALAEYRTAIDLWPPSTYTLATEVGNVSRELLPELAGDSPSRRIAVAARAVDMRPIDLDVVDRLLNSPELAHDPQALTLATRAGMAAKQWELTLQKASELQALAPGSAWPYEAQATAYAQLARFDAARAKLLSGIDATGGAPSLVLAMAELEIHEGRLDEAERSARRLTTRPGTATAASGHATLARIRELQGNRADAVRELERARDDDPRNAVYYLKLAAQHERNGNLGLARSELHRGLATTGGDPVLRQALNRLSSP